MRYNKNSDLWVFIEVKEDGTVEHSGLELMNPGLEIAGKLNGNLVAVLLGDSLDEVIQEISEYGADQIIAVEGEDYREYSTDAYVTAISSLVEKYMPMGLLVAATSNGRDMSPRIACRLKTGLTADCTAVEIDEETNCLLFTRPTLGGNLMACIICQNHWPQMGTIRPGIYKKKKAIKKNVKVIRECVELKDNWNRIKVYDTIRASDVSVDLENAEIIVAGGKGVGSAEGFRMLEELAEALGGTIGASRGAVEKGWIPHAYQIGQTGRTVSPKLYIACGISGAIQHVVGMSSADTIIAINNDRNAPIFRIADYSIVGDVQTIIPLLTKKILSEK